MVRKTPRPGFTLVELSMSIAFISVLAITIAAMTVNLINSYQRGMTLKELNTVGTELVDSLRAAISGSSAKSVSELCKTVYSGTDLRNKCETDSAYSFVLFTNYADVAISGETSRVPISGGFCSGTYSYLWNSGYFFNDDTLPNNTNKLSFKYVDKDGANQEITDFRLLKISDPSRAVCIAATTGATNISNAGTYNNGPIGSIGYIINLTNFSNLTESPTDLLKEDIKNQDSDESAQGNQNLAIYNLFIDKPAQDSQSRNVLYTGSFILATVHGGININAAGDYCVAPNNYISDLNYCAINKFNFAARATGE